MQLLASLNWVSHRVPSSPACRMETSKIENVRSIHSKEVLRLLRRFTHTHTLSHAHTHKFVTCNIVTCAHTTSTHNALLQAQHCHTHTTLSHTPILPYIQHVRSYAINTYPLYHLLSPSVHHLPPLSWLPRFMFCLCSALVERSWSFDSWHAQVAQTS